MKNILVFTFLFVSVNISAQNNAAEDTISQPAITSIGKPQGSKTEMKIGKDGGSITSSDGKIRLIIPPGAVSKKTTFSIQPVINMVPNGNGKAYQLEPSGIVFQHPLQLIFKYDDDEPTDNIELLRGIAMQDNAGKWYGLKKITLDTIAKTITGNINHFSTWASFDKLKLITIPDVKRLKVKKQAYLIILGVSSEPGAESSDDELTELSTWKAPKKVIWSVNGIKKGNKAVGELAVGEETSEATANFNNYVAPDNLPDRNPVAISAEIIGASDKYKGITFSKLTLIKNILIYDNAYEVTMIASINGSAGSVFGNVNYKDTGSFVLSINGKDTKIIEKVNKNADADLDYKGTCIITPLKTGSGNIHIIGTKSIKVIPAASAAENPRIEIEFIRAPTILPVLQFKCPPVGKGDWTTDNNAIGNAMMFMLPAYPQLVKFEAKEGIQFIEQVGGPGQGMFYQVLVRKLKDD